MPIIPVSGEITSQEINDNLSFLDSKVDEQIGEVKAKFPSAISKTEHIGHRGLASISPENTLVSFEQAIYYGADSLEFDVQFTSDQKPVVIHDASVDRTTDGTGWVTDYTLANIVALDAGTWFSPIFEGVRIPELDEVLELARGRSLKVYPEIKGYVDASTDVSTLVNKVIAWGFEENCVMQSFQHSDFGYVRSLSQAITLGYLIGNDVPGFYTALTEAETDGNAVMIADYNVYLSDPDTVWTARGKGIDVIAYTVDNSDVMKRLQEVGVVRYISNKIASVK